MKDEYKSNNPKPTPKPNNSLPPYKPNFNPQKPFSSQQSMPNPISNAELEKECIVCFDPVSSRMACCSARIHQGCLKDWISTHPDQKGICPSCQTKNNFKVI